MAKIPAKPPRLVASQSSSPKIGQPMLLLSSHVRESTKNKRYFPSPQCFTECVCVCGDLLCPGRCQCSLAQSALWRPKRTPLLVCVDRGLCLICASLVQLGSSFIGIWNSYTRPGSPSAHRIDLLISHAPQPLVRKGEGKGVGV